MDAEKIDFQGKQACSSKFEVWWLFTAGSSSNTLARSKSCHGWQLLPELEKKKAPPIFLPFHKTLSPTFLSLGLSFLAIHTIEHLQSKLPCLFLFLINNELHLDLEVLQGSLWACGVGT